ncbi:TetR/AcrR family transcriptional regulator [Georgenia yuyongxinii]|uniref:TetR/AcrR family transcriptional regulator n=1 Tax=Georgenia yuyongxinii TaxID=2589797 RepID=UPI001E391288|nr:TetR/AcrR family transcriptional regulator [Georgenia yuyongxinii]
MTANGARGRGRPVAPVLSAGKITAAAMTLIEARGYGALTMAALARELKVSPSALYNHVTAKQDLLRWIQDHLNQRLDCSAFATEAWDVALERWARSYRDTYAQHAPLVPVIAVAPIRGAPHTVEMYEQVAAGLQRGGWPDALIAETIVAVESFVLGSAMDATSPVDVFEVGDLVARAPVFTTAVKARRGDDPARAAFELGLTALVEGLRARLKAVTPGE